MANDTWVQPFLRSLAETGIVSRACKAVGVANATVSARRQRDADFAAAFDDAMEQAVDMAEAEAWRRAITGVVKPVIRQGQIVYRMRRVQELDADGNPTGRHVYEPELDDDGQPVPLVEHEYSDSLLTTILKGRRKKVFADRTELTGADGGPVEMDSTKRAQRVAALMSVADTRRREAEALAQAAKDFGDIA